MKKSLLLILFAFAWASTDLEAKPPLQGKPQAFPFSVSDIYGNAYQ